MDNEIWISYNFQVFQNVILFFDFFLTFKNTNITPNLQVKRKQTIGRFWPEGTSLATFTEEEIKLGRKQWLLQVDINKQSWDWLGSYSTELFTKSSCHWKEPLLLFKYTLMNSQMNSPLRVLSNPRGLWVTAHFWPFSCGRTSYALKSIGRDFWTMYSYKQFVTFLLFC